MGYAVGGEESVQPLVFFFFFPLFCPSYLPSFSPYIEALCAEGARPTAVEGRLCGRGGERVRHPLLPGVAARGEGEEPRQQRRGSGGQVPGMALIWTRSTINQSH